MSNIKDWIEEDRPREKMVALGSASLTVTELIAILLRAGTREKTAVDLARDVLSLSDGSLTALSRMSLNELQRLQGMGRAKAASLAAAFELGRRAASEESGSEKNVASPHLVAMMMTPLLKDLNHEECWCIFLNSANRIIGREKISSGGIAATVMDSRIIVKKAVEYLATGIILVHNHPSGNPKPSKSDIKNTLALREAASLFDISLADHIIIGNGSYYSFVEERC